MKTRILNWTRVWAQTVVPASVVSILFSVANLPAFAADSPAIEEIIVSAQKRDQSLQEVPLAISAFTEDFLSDRQINNLQDLAGFTPSMQFLKGTSIRNAFLSVRRIRCAILLVRHY